MATHSPFFNAGPCANADSLAILHLKRDLQIPAILQESNTRPNAQDVKNVLNTRYGAYPHSTLIAQPWGSQILASKIDYGSRAKGGKRKRDDKDEGEELRDDVASPHNVETAGVGFAHLLQPTPECWTQGLPHRTQVVYTPDYSFILQKLRVRPGDRLIEAGAGSGSFTHAAARAVFDGTSKGHVYSFEYHEPRAESLVAELNSHRLSDVVTVTHRDVYEHGFSLNDPESRSPKATAIFLDLPSPLLALRNLTRRQITSALRKSLSQTQKSQDRDSASLDKPSEISTPASVQAVNSEEPVEEFISPLDPDSPIHLCTFTPCIEQVQSTVTALRQLGWTQIQMFEIQNRRLDVRRERVGLSEEGVRGSTASPKDVQEAIDRLIAVEGKSKIWEAAMKAQHLPALNGESAAPQNCGVSDQLDVVNKVVVNDENSESETRQNNDTKSTSINNNDKAARKTQKQQRQEQNRAHIKNRKIYKEGILVHRTEADIKTHTSYLTFAVLPIEWTDEDEKIALEKWGTGRGAVQVKKFKNSNKNNSSG